MVHYAKGSDDSRRVRKVLGDDSEAIALGTPELCEERVRDLCCVSLQQTPRFSAQVWPAPSYHLGVWQPFG